MNKPAPHVAAETAFDAFVRTYSAGQPSLVTANLIADLETPVSAVPQLLRKYFLFLATVILLADLESGLRQQQQETSNFLAVVKSVAVKVFQV